ncbi:hypothetical protein [Rhodococcus rhodochrous]|uniref:Uncharacterized protein n=1 Tax=Rhodococcus rhodochrous KG-21 TaxID=1441923 RepID=A0A0M8PRS5_RHORH|nr:hypothetical protein [Rhodococcus rhodochrous]KOS58212.1 hypothetical protein Z051_01280 [Rhodococcus rhodochrous KG-21]
MNTPTPVPHEINLLQALRLKGRIEIEALPRTLAADPASVDPLVTAHVEAGHCIHKGNFLRLTADGKQTLVEWTTHERAALDTTRLEALYEDFDPFNSALKVLITRWQMIDDSTPNDHTDAAYDAAIIDELEGLHSEFTKWLASLTDIVPRLAHYPTRFDSAMNELRDGNYTYVARPIIDSYHTVWFELHEELIGLLGRDRATEAAAGRAV